MVATIGKNISKNDEAVLSSGIAINATTSTLILAAQAAGVADRILVIVYNEGPRDAWIKFQAASVDNFKKGFIIPKNTSLTILENDDIYTGEISAITSTGTATLYLTTF